MAQHLHSAMEKLKRHLLALSTIVEENVIYMIDGKIIRHSREE